jgi:ribosomal protein L37AE/L43A
VSSTPTCPFCGGAIVERVGQWGGQIITSQWQCRACTSYFEAVREDFDDAARDPSTRPSGDR